MLLMEIYYKSRWPWRVIAQTRNRTPFRIIYRGFESTVGNNDVSYIYNAENGFVNHLWYNWH